MTNKTPLNPVWEETTGYRLEEMLGQPFSNFQPSEIAKRDLQEVPHLLHKGPVKGYETIHLSKTGKEFHLSFNAKTLLDDKGTIIGARGTACDITERRRIKEAWRRLPLKSFLPCIKNCPQKCLPYSINQPTSKIQFSGS